MWVQFLCVLLIFFSSLWSFLGFLETNSSVLQVGDLPRLIEMYGIVLFVSFFIYGMLLLLRVTREMSAIAASVSIFLFVNYSNTKPYALSFMNKFLGGAGVEILPIIFIVCSLLPLFLALYFRRDKYDAFKYVFVFLGVISFVSVFSGWKYYKVRATKITESNISQASHAISPAAANAPNVYFILLDAYTSTENLKEFYGLDNTTFISNLRNRGFYMSEKTLSNYDNTICTLSSMTNMQYLPSMAEETNPVFVQKEFFKGRNAVLFEEMRNLGYTTIFSTLGGQMSIGRDGDSISPGLTKEQITSGFKSSSYVLPAKVDSGSMLHLSQAQSSYLGLSPLMDLLDFFDLYVASDYSELNDIDELFQLKEFVPKPYFYFSHILLPHLPGRYDRACRPKTGNKSLRHDFKDATVLNQINDYADNAVCVASQFEQIVDKIIKNDPHSIIIITADHGSAYHIASLAPVQIKELKDSRMKSYSLIEREMLSGLASYSDENKLEDAVRIKHAILSGYRLPNGEKDGEWYDGLSPVNYFRWLLRKLGRQDIDYLEDKVFTGHDYDELKYAHKFLEVTPFIKPR